LPPGGAVDLVITLGDVGVLVDTADAGYALVLGARVFVVARGLTGAGHQVLEGLTRITRDINSNVRSVRRLAKVKSIDDLAGSDSRQLGSASVGVCERGSEVGFRSPGDRAQA